MLLIFQILQNNKFICKNMLNTFFNLASLHLESNLQWTARKTIIIMHLYNKLQKPTLQVCGVSDFYVYLFSNYLPKIWY